MNIGNTYGHLNPNDVTGLTEEEVQLRQQQGLTNRVQTKITKSNGQIIRENVFTLFNAFNLGIAICLALVGAYSNISFLLIIVLNVSIGIIQEIHAKRLVENLSLIGAAKASVIRDGKLCEVPVEDIVLDDMTMLDMGKQVCADSIVVHGKAEVNESMLTGESDCVVKTEGDTLLSGSFIVSGKCYAKVEHVGEDNFAAKLTLEAKQHKQVNSELLNSMRKVTKFTGFFIIPIGILMFLEAYFVRSDSMIHAVISISAALLGMLPKGLVLLISISLITGIMKLSRKRILVQDLYCLETLAHVDMLCLDKTGTITEGKMSVSSFSLIDEEAMPIPFSQAIGCFVHYMDDNNATFIALKEYFVSDSSYPLVNKIPFSSERKWSSITLAGIGSIILGAPEKLFSDISRALPAEVIDAQKSGERIICMAYTDQPILDGKFDGLRLTAIIGLDDPIRKNAKETIDFFRQEGVGIKIISGDNPLTVSSIAKKTGFENHDSYIDLSQVDTYEDLEKAAQNYSIFGRVSPGQKKQLVKIFQSQGHTVAMTGDGVNDVLALREADCGIAMAAGSDAAKQVSQLVLLNSDFTSLPDVVMEGRRVVNNITRFGGIFFVKTIYSIILSIFCILTIKAYPFMPIQIALFDAAVEGYSSFLLSFERNQDRIQAGLLRSVIRRALPYAIMTLISIISLTLAYPLIGISYHDAVATMYYLTGFVGILAVIRACRPFNRLRLLICGTTFIGFYFAVYLFSGILHLEISDTFVWLLMMGMAALCLPIIKLLTLAVDKLFQRH